MRCTGAARTVALMSTFGTVAVGAAFLPTPMTGGSTTAIARANMSMSMSIKNPFVDNTSAKLCMVKRSNRSCAGERRRKNKKLRGCLLGLGLFIISGMGRAAFAASTISTASTASAAVPALEVPTASAVNKLKAEVELCWRLIFASIGGALVGLERSTSDHPAGVRTMALVSLGACAFTLCSMFGFLAVAASSSAAKLDPSRMASNVASGVGFIGAGVITNNRKSSGVYDRQSSVNGLTTAAAIWVAAAVGVASGVGLYVVAATAAASTIAILRFSKLKNTAISKRVLRVAKRDTLFKKEAPVVFGDDIAPTVRPAMNKPEILESTKIETASSKVADPLVEKYLWGVHEQQQEKQQHQPSKAARADASSKRGSSSSPSSTVLHALNTPSEPATNKQRTKKQTITQASWENSESANNSNHIQVSDILDAAANSSAPSTSIVPPSPKICIEEEQRVILKNSGAAPVRTTAAGRETPNEKTRERRSNRDSPKP